MIPDLALPKALLHRDDERTRAYARELAFFRGDQWGYAMTPNTTTNVPRMQKRRLVHNYARAFINKAAAYTMHEVRTVIDPTDTSASALRAASQAETALDQVADQNALDQLDFDNEILCCVYGDAAYKITWSEELARVSITAPDPGALSVWRRADNRLLIDRVAQRTRLNADEAAFVYGGFASSSNASNYIEVWDAETYTLYINGAIAFHGANPYGFIPFVIYPNIHEPGREWGTSDIAVIREPAAELNRVLTQLSLIAELSGNPITVLENVTQDTDIAVQPGAVWEMPADSRAYILDLLANGGVRLLLDYAQEIKSIMYDLGESPPASFGTNSRGLSGVALNVELDPIVKKVRRKRLIRGRAFAQRSSMVLDILRQQRLIDPLIAVQQPRTDFGDVLPNDAARDIANGVARINGALSTRVRVMAELGIPDPAAELAAWEAEAAAVSKVQPTHTPTPAIVAPAGP